LPLAIFVALTTYPPSHEMPLPLVEKLSMAILGSKPAIALVVWAVAIAISASSLSVGFG